MRIIIAGTRRLWSPALVREAIRDSGFDITFMIVGGAPGIDRTAEDVAVIDGISHQVYKADWNKYGSVAGPIRNEQMADHPADGLIALPDFESVGTRDMIDVMEKRGLPVYVREIE